MAAFKINQSRDNFVKDMQEKYNTMSKSYVMEKAIDAWNTAAQKIQEEMKKTRWREEAILAQEQGLTKDEWKKKKLAEIDNPVTEAADSQLADETWMVCLNETKAI